MTYLRTDHQAAGTYHIHRGPDRAAALAFLRAKPVTERLEYVIVETPEGNLGRDFIYLFEEADGRPIEPGPRTPRRTPVPSATHCAWCGCYVTPIEIPDIAGQASTYSVHVTHDELIENGAGFTCATCGLVQCTPCSPSQADDGGFTSSCRSCSGPVRFHAE